MQSQDWPKAVTTASIWISMGFALGFGVFKMNFSGPGIIMCPALTLLLLGAGLWGTSIVWRRNP